MPTLADLAASSADNPGGTLQAIYFAPYSTFATIQKEGGLGAAAIADIAVISTDHTFKTGGQFYKIDLEINKNELGSEFQGAIASGAQKFNFTGMIPNISAEILGTLRLAASEKVIALIPLADGQFVQLGEEDNAAVFKYNLQTGSQEGGERGNIVNIEAYHQPKLYTGTIARTPAV